MRMRAKAAPRPRRIGRRIQTGRRRTARISSRSVRLDILDSLLPRDLGRLARAVDHQPEPEEEAVEGNVAETGDLRALPDPRVAGVETPAIGEAPGGLERARGEVDQAVVRAGGVDRRVDFPPAGEAAAARPVRPQTPVEAPAHGR